MTDNGNINVKIQNGIAAITFSHPKSNSLPGELLRNLAKTIEETGQNESAKVIILQSEGQKAFCAGASFNELISINTFEEGKKFFMGFGLVINAMRKCPKIIIGKIQGKAVGGGVGLASAVDYAFAHKSASIKLSEFALGIGPFVVGPAVQRKIGVSAFSQMSIDTDWYDADWALSKGLYAKVFETNEELNGEVQAFAEKLAELSPEAAYEMKKIFWQGCEDWDDLLEKRAEISGKLVLSDYTKNYINQFKKD
ncbi:MAG: enoyl-CoA hydratase/isomerase family protein [Candidatus Kapabacteria bacterium]|nr:enoyl-CoA hydratase/isomerase family protein [Candidatus Kapabacteria bacterium]